MATKKQVKALAILAENGGNVSKAMIAAGYSPQTAKTPQKLTESQGFLQLLEDTGLSDYKLAEKLNEGLEAAKQNEYTGEIVADFPTRHKYLETALRVKGYGKVGSTLNLQTDGGEVKVMIVNYGESNNPAV